MQHPVPAERRFGFTLLEVIVATMIVALLSLTLHRFLTTHLTAIQITTEATQERSTLQSVVKFLRTQLNDLPPLGREMLVGRPNRFHGLSNDQITWHCSPGQGL